jgi:hypothetical protein
VEGVVGEERRGEERRVVVEVAEVGVVGEERRVAVEVGVAGEDRRVVEIVEVEEEALQSCYCLSKGAYINTVGIYNHSGHI